MKLLGFLLLVFGALGPAQMDQSNQQECLKKDVPCVVVTHLKEFGIGTVDIRGRWKVSKNKNQVTIHCDRIQSLIRPNEHDLTEYCHEAVAEIDPDGDPEVYLYTYIVGAQAWRDAEAMGQLTVQSSSNPCFVRTLVISFAGSVSLVETPTNTPGCKSPSSTNQMGSYFPKFHRNVGKKS